MRYRTSSITLADVLERVSQVVQEKGGNKKGRYSVIPSNSDGCCCSFDVLEIKLVGQPLFYIVCVCGKLVVSETPAVEILFLLPVRLDYRSAL